MRWSLDLVEGLMSKVAERERVTYTREINRGIHDPSFMSGKVTAIDDPGKIRAVFLKNPMVRVKSARWRDMTPKYFVSRKIVELFDGKWGSKSIMESHRQEDQQVWVTAFGSRLGNSHNGCNGRSILVTPGLLPRTTRGHAITEHQL